MTKLLEKTADQSELIGQKVYRRINIQLRSIDEKTRTLTAVASDPSTDRHGESINQAGWQLDNYLKNPVGLLFHNHEEFPVFQAVEMHVEDGALVFTAQFATAEQNPKAEIAWQLYKGGYMRAFSVGFIPYEMEGNIFMVQELIEISCVTVPSNPNALTLAWKEGVVTDVQAKEWVGAMDTQVKEIKRSMANQDMKQVEGQVAKIIDHFKSLTGESKVTDNNVEGDPMPDYKIHVNISSEKELTEAEVKEIGDTLASVAKAKGLQMTLKAADDDDDTDDVVPDATDTETKPDEAVQADASDDDTDTDTAAEGDENTDTTEGEGTDGGEANSSDESSGEGADDTSEEVDPENLTPEQAAQVEEAYQKAYAEEQAAAAGKVE